ncbi:hypothetical protein H5P36_24830 [Bacillus sp. APMAM]|nr:hypothetical protein [Bacillus sp. APMAM]RTZ53189.1 hypothetical protein EKO25_24615 [Bacillus sp. SAJ1]
MAILISTPQELNDIRNNLTGAYELANDIDMSSFGNFTPIGTTTDSFKGTLDGKGYRILNLSITTTIVRSGLFGRTDGATIQNLGLENIYVESNNDYVGGLVGTAFDTTIRQCYVTGTVKQTVTSRYYCGGLVSYQTGVIENCFTNCTVTGGTDVGGLVGYSFVDTTIIKNSFSIGVNEHIIPDTLFQITPVNLPK